MIEGDFQVIVSNKKQEASIKIDVQIHLRIHRSHLTKERSSAIYCDHFMLLRSLVPCLTSSVPDFGNLSCPQITGATLKNPNIEMRIFKILNKNLIDTTISCFGH